MFVKNLLPSNSITDELWNEFIKIIILVSEYEEIIL